MKMWGCQNNYPDENGDCIPNKTVRDNNVFAEIIQDFDKLLLIILVIFNENVDNKYLLKNNFYLLKEKLMIKEIKSFYVFGSVNHR